MFMGTWGHGDMGTWGHGDMGTVNPYESSRIFVNLHECESLRILMNHHLSLSIVRSQGVMGHGHGFTLLDSWGVILVIMGSHSHYHGDEERRWLTSPSQSYGADVLQSGVRGSSFVLFRTRSMALFPSNMFRVEEEGWATKFQTVPFWLAYWVCHATWCGLKFMDLNDFSLCTFNSSQKQQPFFMPCKSGIPGVAQDSSLVHSIPMCLVLSRSCCHNLLSGLVAIKTPYSNTNSHASVCLSYFFRLNHFSINNIAVRYKG